MYLKLIQHDNDFNIPFWDALEHMWKIVKIHTKNSYENKTPEDFFLLLREKGLLKDYMIRIIVMMVLIHDINGCFSFIHFDKCSIKGTTDLYSMGLVFKCAKDYERQFQNIVVELVDKRPENKEDFDGVLSLDLTDGEIKCHG